MNKWISVKDKMPENCQECLTYGYDNFFRFSGFYIDRYQTDKGWIIADGYSRNTVTHWMPLPEPPGNERDVYSNDNI